MKIIIVAGGTGGHLYPGIAAARALQGNDIRFIVRRGDLGRGILEKEGFAVEEITGQGLPRALSLRLVTFPLALIRGVCQAKRLLKRERPDVILAMGGYLSAPVVWSAHRLGIRTLLHEQNVIPGLANRWLSRIADSVAVSFSESIKEFPVGKAWLSGLPVRTDIGKTSAAQARSHFKLNANRLTILVFGGSLGARRINQTVIEAWPKLSDRKNDFQVLHITGERDYEAIQKQYQSLPVNAVVLPYCHEMGMALSAADFVVSRSGASTVAELWAAQKPSLLIPYPYATNNHQLFNAEILVKRGLAELMSENDLTANTLAARLKLFINSPEKLLQIKSRFSDNFQSGMVGDSAKRLAAHLTKEST